MNLEATGGKSKRGRTVLAGLATLLMIGGEVNAADRKSTPASATVRAPWMKDAAYDSRQDPEAPKWIRQCLAVKEAALATLARRKHPDMEEVYTCPNLPEIIDPLDDQLSREERAGKRISTYP